MQKKSTEKNSPVLEVKGLSAGYAGNTVLTDVSFDVFPGEVVTLLGRNGAGKSTTLKCLMGLIREKSGSISIAGMQSINFLPEQVAKLGIAFCPEERGIFSQLNVLENLMLPPVLSPGGMTVEEIYQLFPNLLERKFQQGTKLSGGEQQMLAIARILRTGAKLLLLDEPSEGLAPVIVKLIGKTIQELKKRGYTIVLVEQNLKFASELADRHYVMENGRIVEMLTKAELESHPARVEVYLGV